LLKQLGKHLLVLFLDYFCCKKIVFKTFILVI